MAGVPKLYAEGFRHAVSAVGGSLEADIRLLERRKRFALAAERREFAQEEARLAPEAG